MHATTSAAARRFGAMPASRVVPWALEDDGPSVGRRVPGALLGGAIALVPAAGALLLLDNTFLLLGVPAAFVAGAALAPAVRANAMAEAVLAMAALTTALAEVITFLVRPHELPAPADVEIFALGLIFVGVPMSVLTVPCALVWAVLVRRVGRPGGPG